MGVRVDNDQPSVVIIDDDAGLRIALDGLLRTVGLHAELFGSVQEFHDGARLREYDCLVLDVRLPGRSGLDYLEELAKATAGTPAILISGHADVPMAVRAMKAGAVDFLTKPVRPQDLLDAISRAIEKSRAAREAERAAAAIKACLDSLTPREREVMELVVQGCLNKRIAAEIGITEATVKVHRGQVMRKTKARSVADLVRMADELYGTATTAVTLSRAACVSASQISC